MRACCCATLHSTATTLPRWRSIPALIDVLQTSGAAASDARVILGGQMLLLEDQHLMAPERLGNLVKVLLADALQVEPRGLCAEPAGPRPNVQFLHFDAFR